MGNCILLIKDIAYSGAHALSNAQKLSNGCAIGHKGCMLTANMWQPRDSWSA